MNENVNDEKDIRLGELLARAEHPTTTSNDLIRNHVAVMARTVVEQDRQPRKRRAGIIAAILAPTLLLGTAGAAYAASTIDWGQFWFDTHKWAAWAEEPDAVLTYTLPGGGTCEMRIGEVRYSPDPNRPANVIADPRSETAARDFFRTNDVAQLVDVDAAISNLRATDGNWAMGDDGEWVPFGEGTSNYNADVEYNIAMKDAVSQAVTDHVESLGIPMTGLGFQSQEQCDGEQR
ncbi:hypothetical protein C3B59_06720 [Cryobacterium zongtaii]|uniref:Uncharacterized protein n=1 Tax=Cryobacterium zongtaii TaxID=1259217 RepID=A0A2S3ZJJ9_9MICO|nr:hypothetical protein [Cryobacterium zongtaii]POH68202.1 hypothetical protein C3B59_06720 [Cryobacterium zongtaii]